MTLPANPYTCLAATPTAPTTARLMSRFGMRQGVSSGVRRLHAGVDIGGERGQLIYSVKPGVVTIVGRDSVRGGPLNGYGNGVVVYHPDEGRWVLYAHLDRALVAPGAHVEAGQPVGTMGATTNGKFPRMVHHLHLEVRRAQPDGSSPFPGRYGAFNEDPAAWLAAAGIGFSRDGLTYDPAQGACGSGAAAGELAMLQAAPTLRGLGAQVEAIRLGDAPAGDGEVYEPPIPDRDWFRKPAWWVRWGLPLAGAAVGLAGVAVTLRSFER